MRPISADLGFNRVTDIVYARHHGEVAHLFFLQVSQFGGDTFYVNYGASLPKLGVPWYPERPLKDEGLLIDARLYNADSGQAYDCGTKAALERSLAQVHADLKSTAIPWFTKAKTVTQIAKLYYHQWDLRPLGKNQFLKRNGVMQYAFIQLLQGDRNAALAWFSEARKLMTDTFDEEDRMLIDQVTREISAA
ncbi:MAG: hypothetical protein JNN20_00440 [Betaproteobacteria bacterium]|nr:hypothetical protein [Betaproteobacteria bacterium]